MNHFHKSFSIVLVLLASLLLTFVGCSDLLIQMGEVALRIEAENSIRTYVTEYTISGSLEGSKATINLPVVLPGNEVIIPNIAPGKWSFTVLAFEGTGANRVQIGKGVQEIVLKEGQKVGLRVQVQFEPLPLTIGDPTFPSSRDKVYDGTNTLEVTAGSLSGLRPGDEKVSARATATYRDKNVGANKPITVAYTLNYSQDPDIAGKYAPLDLTISHTGSITEKPLTITAPSFPRSRDKVYDGTNTLPVQAGSLVGIMGDDDVSVTAQATYVDSDAGNNKSLIVTYALSGQDAANYTKPVDDTTIQGTITPKILDLSLHAIDKYYDANNSATGHIRLGGIVGFDDVSATGTFAFEDANVSQSPKIVNVTDITLTGAKAGNYSLATDYAQTSAMITKATYNMDGVTFKGKSVTYDGNAHSLALEGTLPAGVSVSYRYSPGNRDAGSHEVTAVFSKDDVSHEPIADMTATLTIQKKALTTAGTYPTLSKVYDQNLNAQVEINQIVSGKIPGDDMLLLVDASYDSASVDTTKPILVSYTVYGSDAKNYSKPEDYRILTGAITPIQLSISAPSFPKNVSKEYDGTTAIGVTAGIPKGVLAGETVTVTPIATYENKDVGTNKIIQVAYTLGGSHAENYLAPNNDIIYAGTITPIQLSIANPSFASTSKEYDGSTTLAVTAGKISGFLPTDSVAVTASAAFRDKNVGNNKGITVSYALDNTNADAKNYLAPASYTEATGVITARQLSMTAPFFPDSTDKIYDGKTTLAVTKGRPEGVVLGDWIGIDAIARYATKDVGSDKTISVTYTIDGPNAHNYLAPAEDTSFMGMITPIQLGIANPSFPDTTTKSYDGDTSLAVSQDIPRGFIGGETVAVTASAAFRDKNVGENKAITVSYALDQTNIDAKNYRAPRDFTVQTGAITPIQLSIPVPSFPNTMTKAYNGDTGLAVSQDIPSGFIGGESVALTASAAFRDKNVGENKAITVSYALDTTNTDSKNYLAPAVYTVQTGTITPIQLSITIPTFASTSKEYDGSATLAVTAGELSGFLPGESVAVTASAAFRDKNVGGDKAITVSYALDQTNRDAKNYIAPASYTEATGVITTKQLSMTAPSFPDSTDKIYDGKTPLAVAKGTLSGVVDGDEVTVEATAAYTNKDVGENKAITVSYVLDGPDAPNYSVLANVTTSGSIAKRQLTIGAPSFPDSTTKAYDGLTTLAVTAGELNGFLPGESVALTTTAMFADKNVGENKVIIVSYALDDTDADAKNYRAPAAYTVQTGTITPIQLSITNPTFASTSKEYDGSATLAVTAGELSGFLPNESVAITASAAYADKDAGKNKTITVSYALDNTNTDAKNYLAPVSYTENTGVITTRQLSMTAPSFPDSTHKIYDGKTPLAVAKGTLSGVVDGDEVTVEATAAYTNKDVGENKAITVSYVLGGLDALNYRALPNTTTSGSIAKRQLVIGAPSFPDTTTKAYDGDTGLASAAGTPTGFIGFETVAVTASAAFRDKNAGENKAITVSYVLDNTNTDSKNYLAPVSYTEATGTVTPIQLSITAPSFPDSTDKIYDGKTLLSVAKGTLEGVVAGDWIAVDATARYTTKDVGIDKTIKVTYTIDGPNAQNYLAPAEDTSFRGTITGAKLYVSDPVLEMTKVYDSSDACQVSPGRIVSGIVGEEIVTVLATAAYDTKDFGSNKAITVSYALDASNADAQNYLAPDDYRSSKGTIEKRQLTIADPVIANVSKIYDGNDSVVFEMGGVSGIYGTEDVQVTAQGRYLTAKAEANKYITVAYSLAGTTTGNYLVPESYWTKTGEITKKPLTVESGSTQLETTKTYDGSSSVTVTKAGILEGLVGTLEDVVLEAGATYSDKKVGSNKDIAVSYALTGSGASNYTVPSATTSNRGTITAKALSVQAGTTRIRTEKLFDDTSAAEVLAVGTLVGIVENDDVVLGASASYDDATATTDKLITVVYSLDGSDAANYSKPMNNTSFTGRIDSGKLTISDPVLIKTKMYNSSQDCIVFPGNFIEGIIGSDSVQVHAVATYDTKNAGPNKRITVVYSLTGTDAAKYTAPENYVVTDGEVLRKQLSITPPIVPNTSKPYDGETSVVFTPGTVKGKYTTDLVSVVSSGFYLSPSLGTDKQIFFTYTLEGSDAGNYFSPVYEVLYSASITKRPLSVQAGTTEVVTEKTYNRSPSAVVTAAGTLTNIVASDEVTLSATASYLDSTAGIDKDIVVTYTLGGKDADKYQKPEDKIIKGVITAKQIAVTASADPKTYDGTANAEGRLTINDGAILGEDVVSATGIFSFENTNIGINKAVSVTGIQLLGAQADNYSVAATASTIGTIERAILTATVENTSKIYGNANPVFAINVTGFVEGEDAGTFGNGYSAPVATTTAIETSSVGEYEITLTGGSANNYSFNLTDTALLTINKATHMMDGITFTDKSVTYDGTSHSLVIDGTLPDGVVPSYSNNSQTNAGALTVVASFVYDTTNYNVIDSMTATLTINKAILTATVEDASKTYGDANPLFAVTVTGFVGGEDAGTADSYTAPIATSGAITTSNAGTSHAIDITGGSARNYSFDRTDRAVLSITKATYNMDGVTFDGKTVTYDGEYHPLEIGGSPLPNGVSVRYNNNSQRKVTDLGHTVSAIFTGSSNYKEIPAMEAVLTITPKILTVTASVNNRAYNKTTNASGTLSHNPEEVIAGDYIRMSDNSTFTFLDANAGPDKTVTVSNVQIWGGDASNYTFIEPVTTTATINKATYYWGWVHYKSPVYNGQAQGPIITGLPAGVTYTYSNKEMVNNGGYTTDITFYGDYANYEEIPNEVGKSVYINQKPISIKKVTFNDKVFDGETTATGTFELEGVIGTDEAVPIFSSEGFEFETSQASDELKPIYVWINSWNLGGAQGKNYKYVSGTPNKFEGFAKINKKPLTVKATASGKTYSGNTNAWGELELVGLVKYYTATAEGTFAFVDANAGENKIVNVTGITISGSNVNNYYLESDSTTTTATIEKAKYSTNWYEVEDWENRFTYSGAAKQAALSIRNGYTIPDGLEIIYSDNNNQVNVGTYAVTASFQGDETNYEVMDPVQLTLTIDPMWLTPKPVVLGKDYDGTTDASGTIHLVNYYNEEIGPPAGDDVGATGNFVFRSAEASPYSTVDVTDITLTGDSAGNYTLKATNAYPRAEIRKATYDMSTVAYNNKTVTYNGEIQPLEISGSLPEGVTVRDYYHNDKVDAGEYTIEAHFRYDDKNFNTIGPMIATLTIEKKPLTITGASVYPKEYDGTTEGSGKITIEGGVSGRDISLEGTFTFSDPNVGENKEVVVTNLNAYEFVNYTTNYTFPLEYRTTGTITKATYNMNNHGFSDKSFVYDGEAHSLTIANESSLPSGVTVSYENNDRTIAGSQVVTANFGYDSNSYNTIDPLNATLTVEKKLLTVRAHVEDKVYDGTSNFTTSLSLEGVVGTDVVHVAGRFYLNSYAGYQKGSVYPVTLSGDDVANYRISESSVPYAFTVHKAIFSPPADFFVDKEVVYDGNYHILEHGALPVGLTVSPATFQDKTNVGTYSTTINFVSDNYEPIYPLSATLSITPKELTVAVSVDTKPYDGTTAGTGTLTFGGKVANDYEGLSSTVNTFTFDTADAGVNKNVEVTGIELSGANSHNYSLPSPIIGFGSIEKAVMTGSVVITGEMGVGYTLTAVTNLPIVGEPTYQWKRGGSVISGATGKTYTLVPADGNKTITVTATAQAGEKNYTGSVTSDSTVPILPIIVEAYFPASPSLANIINLTGFEANRAGLEAAVALNGNYYTPYSDLQVDSRGRARIYVSGNAHLFTKVKIRQKAVGSTPAGPEREILVGSKDLAVGDYYEGGIVGSFFTGDYIGPGYGSGTPKGLIVAETDQGSTRWDYRTDRTAGVNFPSIGNGRDSERHGAGFGNTQMIKDAIGFKLDTGEYNAAGLASSFGGGGKNDWFLPSRNELESLGYNESAIGGFVQTRHWTSSEARNGGPVSALEHAYGKPMPRGYQTYITKTENLMVRAVRYF